MMRYAIYLMVNSIKFTTIPLLLLYIGAVNVFAVVVEEPTVITAVAPIYPATANGPLLTDISGVVQVKIQVDKLGNVISSHAINGHPLLQNAAVSAAQHWRFTATDIEVVRVVLLTFVFRIMPKITSAEELTPVFNPPYQIEVKRRAVEVTPNLSLSTRPTRKNRRRYTHPQ